MVQHLQRKSQQISLFHQRGMVVKRQHPKPLCVVLPSPMFGNPDLRRNFFRFLGDAHGGRTLRIGPTVIAKRNASGKNKRTKDHRHGFGRIRKQGQPRLFHAAYRNDACRWHEWKNRTGRKV